MPNNTIPVKSDIVGLYSSIPHVCGLKDINPLSVNPTKWSNTLKRFECAWPFCKVVAKRVKENLDKRGNLSSEDVLRILEFVIKK